MKSHLETIILSICKIKLVEAGDNLLVAKARVIAHQGYEFQFCAGAEPFSRQVNLVADQIDLRKAPCQYEGHQTVPTALAIVHVVAVLKYEWVFIHCEISASLSQGCPHFWVEYNTKGKVAEVFARLIHCVNLFLLPLISIEVDVNEPVLLDHLLELVHRLDYREVRVVYLTAPFQY